MLPRLGHVNSTDEDTQDEDVREGGVYTRAELVLCEHFTSHSREDWWSFRGVHTKVVVLPDPPWMTVTRSSGTEAQPDAERTTCQITNTSVNVVCEQVAKEVTGPVPEVGEVWGELWANDN